MSSNSIPVDLRAALGDEPDGEALERVWHLLGEVPAADTDAAWHALRTRLDVAPAVSRRAADRPAARRSARPARARWAVASVLAAAVAAAVVWLAVPVAHYAAPGETLAVTLPDGSAVTLASDATLRHARRFGASRDVALTGEAFFEVEPGTVPFTVATHNARVVVLGTAFNVRAWDGETAVALVHGAVRVTDAAGEAEAALAPGEALTVAADGIAPRDADVAREAAWREGALAFDDRPLGAVLREVERRYGVRIDADADAPTAARVSAFYAARPALDALLGDLGAVAGARFAPGPDGYRVRAAEPTDPRPPAPTPRPAPPTTTP